jgi:hypothetical protein
MTQPYRPGELTSQGAVLFGDNAYPGVEFRGRDGLRPQQGELDDRLLGHDPLDVQRAKPKSFVAGPLRLFVASQRAEDLVTDDHNVLSLIADEQARFEQIIRFALAVESGEKSPLAGWGAGAATSQRPFTASIPGPGQCATSSSREAASCCRG